MSKSARLAGRLDRFLSRDGIEQAVASYLAPGAYTGALFDQLSNRDDTDRYTETDFLAVSTLSVSVPPVTRQWLLGEGADYVSNLLKHIPRHRDAIVDDYDHLRSHGAAWELWYLLRQGSGMGATTTSKLMAVKRPHLVPIHDSVVSAALEIPVKNSWSTWRSYMRSRPWAESKAEIRRAADDAGGVHLSDLRVVDIVVWFTETERLKAERAKKRAAKGLKPKKAKAPCPDDLKPSERWDGKTEGTEA
jgi:hypothetical protein